MSNTTHATPEPDDSTPTDPVRGEAPVTTVPGRPVASADPPLVARSLSTGTIVGIALGGVALAALLFGGGVAVGSVLPVGAPGGFSQTGLPGENGGHGGPGTRPDLSRGDTNPPGPSAPNSGGTETDDDSDAGS